ncbi:MAG: alpha/beta fold hydrolase [Rhodothermales bacterium]|nr:alpha/beta fold hydrolase [Rhodothermales bacterium]
MPYLTVNDCRYYVFDTGAPHEGAETVFFGHGYLMTHRVFEQQIEALRGRYRCVAPDWRGQGDTEVTRDGYDPWDLARDAEALITHLGLGAVHYVGFSMGGFVGVRLALLRPDLLRTLALLDTSASDEPAAAKRKYTALLWAVRTLGYDAVIDRVMPILFGPAFRSDPARRAEVERWKGIITSNSRTGIFRAGRGIFGRDSVLDRLGEIRRPTLLLVGEHDGPTPPALAREAHRRLPAAELVEVADAGHTTPVERPERVTAALEAFLGRHRSDG